MQEGSMFFPLPLLVFIFSWKFILKHLMKKIYLPSPSFAALIQVLKVVFHLGIQNKFPGKKTGNGKGKT
jgi:hypothetical protein